MHKNNFYFPFGVPFDSYIDYDDFMKMERRNKRLAVYEGIILEDDVAAKVPGLARWDSSHIPTMGAEVNEILKTKPAETMKMSFFNHKRIEGTIDLAKSSMVFFSIPFDIGWKAKVDGAAKELVQAHIGFTGLFVEPGNHKIELPHLSYLFTTDILSF